MISDNVQTMGADKTERGTVLSARIVCSFDAAKRNVL
jgi:hypothetical protein